MGSYVEYGGLGSAPGPLICEGTTLYCFWVQASPERLAKLCREVFDEPSAGAVRAEPLLPFVMLTFGEVESITAGPPYGTRGRVTERQVGVWVPIVARWRDESGPREEVGVFLPWMWLDNPISVASGREVYGYPKTWGWATFPGEKYPRGIFDFAGDSAPYQDHLPPDPQPSTCFGLDSFALRRHVETERPRRSPLIRVRPVGDDEGAGASAPSGGEAAARGRRRRAPRSRRGLAKRTGRELAGALREAGVEPSEDTADLEALWLPRQPARFFARLLRLLRKLTPRWLRRALGRIETGPIHAGLLLAFGGDSITQFFLRQFRSPVDGAQASYHDVVRADATVLPRPELEISILGAHEIEIIPVDSDPLVETLGIENGPTHAELKLSFDFKIEPGEVLWRGSLRNPSD